MSPSGRDCRRQIQIRLFSRIFPSESFVLDFWRCLAESSNKFCILCEFCVVFCLYEMRFALFSVIIGFFDIRSYKSNNCVSTAYLRFFAVCSCRLAICYCLFDNAFMLLAYIFLLLYSAFLPDWQRTLAFQAEFTTAANKFAQKSWLSQWILLLQPTFQVLCCFFSVYMAGFTDFL